jgi:hypothetical protein
MKKERLARALGISHFKISDARAVEQSAAKIQQAIPGIVSFKVGTKTIKPDTKKRKIKPKGGRPSKYQKKK